MNIGKRHKRLLLYNLLEVLGLLLGIVIFGYLTIVSLRIAFNAEYVQIFGLILGFIFGLISIYFLVSLFNFFRKKDTMGVSWVIGIIQKKCILTRYFPTFFAILSFITSISVYKNKNKQNDFVEITITQTNDSEIHVRRKKGHNSISIFSKEYPNYIFQIKGIYFNYMDSESYVKNVKRGDTLTLMITQESYDKKIAKTKTLSFTDKTVNYNFIDFCGLKHRNFELLSTKDYKYAMKSYSVETVLLFSAIGILFLYFQWKFDN